MIRLTAVHLTHGQADQLAALGEATFPREACALLVGTENAPGELHVTEIVPARNLATAPEREFELDPAVQFSVMRRLRETNETNLRLIGHWHSHPNGRAAPSMQDAAMIHDRSLVWLIGAVQDGRAGRPTAWQPNDKADGFLPLALKIEEQDS